jgi:hypothetical protein
MLARGLAYASGGAGGICDGELHFVSDDWLSHSFDTSQTNWKLKMHLFLVE